MNPGTQQPQLWIGLVEFKPLDRNTQGYAGSFSSVVTWAQDVGGFREKADIIAAELDLYVVDVEWAEPLAERFRNRAMTDEVEDMVFRAESNPNAIIYGTFYTYPFDTA